MRDLKFLSVRESDSRWYKFLIPRWKRPVVVHSIIGFTLEDAEDEAHEKAIIGAAQIRAEEKLHKAFEYFYWKPQRPSQLTEVPHDKHLPSFTMLVVDAKYRSKEKYREFRQISAH
jgi:hypothetical protein